jgi:hypothetical protein
MHREHGWVGRKDRHAVELDAVVHRVDGCRLPVRLADFSEEGCRIEGANDFRIGEHLSIDVPRLGLVKAQIRWALHDSAGAKFLGEIEV